MATSVVMPALEMAQETGKLLKWYATEGHAVSKGDLLMSIETDKAVVDVEADASGILSGVRARDGDVIRVGQVIAWILAPGEPIPQEQDAPVSGRAQVVGAGEPASPASAPTGGSGGDAGPVLLSPKARRLAAERGVDVRTLTGSGPGGAVVAADLEKTATRQEREELGTVWRLMAERVTASWTTVPHFFLTRDIDAGGLQDARERFGTRAGHADPRPTVTDLLVAIVARTLARHRRVNASWVEGTIRYHDAINVGMATAVEEGLVVPVIHGADRLSVADITRRRTELVARARAGRLQPADLTGGTITISNLGMYDVDAFSAIVNTPQAVILAVGRIADRVVPRDGQVVIRPVMSVTLSADHRVVDGARAAEFLRDLARALEQPETTLAGGFHRP